MTHDVQSMHSMHGAKDIMFLTHTHVLSSPLPLPAFGRLLYTSFPSMKDPSFETRFPGKSTAEIISTAHSEWFTRHLSTGSKQSSKRGIAEYDSVKKTLETKLLEGLHTNYPKTRGRVEFVSIGTPLTNLFYLGRADSYGLEHTPERYGGALDLMRPQTTIPGLFLTGQDVASVGIVGALNGGILTAHAVLGYGMLDLVLAKRNLIEDLMAVEGWGKSAVEVAAAKSKAVAAVAVALAARSGSSGGGAATSTRSGSGGGGRTAAAIACIFGAVVCVVAAVLAP